MTQQTLKKETNSSAAPSNHEITATPYPMGNIEDAVSWELSYIAPPLISRSTVWSTGLVLFALAMIWPPLLLLVTAVASILIPYSFRITDDASTRRSLLYRFDQDDHVSAHRREIPDDVRLETCYWTNSRGLLLHTGIMTPIDKPIKAVVGYCHGYSDNASHTRRKELIYFVQHGIAVVMIESEGHGRSDGPLGLLPDWNVMCMDLHTYFQEVVAARFPTKKFFLLGESMGGAVAYTIIRDFPDCYAGVVFQAPMCKISDDMLPPNWVIELLRMVVGPSGTVSFLGLLPISPTRGDLRMLTFKLPQKRAICTRHPAVFGRRPRLATGREFINVTKRISDSIQEFDAPFLVQHGDSDRVTDPELSRALYRESSSKDKTIHLYEGMWHSLLAGEPDENVERVQNDATKWILERAEKKDQ